MHLIATLAVDDHQIFLDAIADFLHFKPQTQINVRALPGRSTLTRVDEQMGDLVVAIDLVDTDGLDAVRQIIAGALAPRVVILTMHDLPYEN